MKAIIEVARAHTIDAADPQVIETLNRERISQLAQKHQLSL
jgi:cell division protein FtsL